MTTYNVVFILSDPDGAPRRPRYMSVEAESAEAALESPEVDAEVEDLERDFVVDDVAVAL